MTTSPDPDPQFIYSGIDLSPGVDFDEVLASAIASPSRAMGARDESSYDWLAEILERLPTDSQTGLIKAACALLSSGDRKQIDAAIALLRSWNWHAQIGSLLYPALENNQHLSQVGGADLIGQAWHAYAASYSADDSSTRDKLRLAALEPGLGRWVVASLGRHDTDWLASNADHILAATPQASETLHSVLSRHGSSAD